jgi:hypothetical protein
LAATALTTAARLWTRDKRLAAVDVQHGLARFDDREQAGAALNLP